MHRGARERYPRLCFTSPSVNGARIRTSAQRCHANFPSRITGVRWTATAGIIFHIFRARGTDISVIHRRKMRHSRHRSTCATQKSTLAVRAAAQMPAGRSQSERRPAWTRSLKTINNRLARCWRAPICLTLKPQATECTLFFFTSAHPRLQESHARRWNNPSFGLLCSSSLSTVK